MPMRFKTIAMAAGLVSVMLVLTGAAAVQHINGDVVVNGTLTANSLKIAPETSVADELSKYAKQIIAIQGELRDQRQLLDQAKREASLLRQQLDAVREKTATLHVSDGQLRIVFGGNGLHFQRDGNLVIGRDGKAIWATATERR